MNREVRELLNRAKEFRLSGDHAAAGIIEKEAASILRMEAEEKMVAAGTHWYHPVSGRFHPRPQ